MALQGYSFALSGATSGQSGAEVCAESGALAANSGDSLLQVSQPSQTGRGKVAAVALHAEVADIGHAHGLSQRCPWHCTQKDPNKNSTASEEDRHKASLMAAKSTFTRLQEDSKPYWKPAEGYGSTAPLDNEGFRGVTAMCCPKEMERFFTRLLEAQGYFVCSVPHIQGLAHWFQCDPYMTIDYPIGIIENGNPCKYWTPFGQECPELSPECAGHVPEDPPCPDGCGYPPTPCP